jgi:carbamoyl-phosphate synthase large subunit
MNVMKDLPSLQRVVFASSYLIYKPELYQFPQPAKAARPLHEDDPIDPRNLCGAAKLLHEKELRFLSEFSNGRLRTVSVRIYRVYGKNSRDVISRWIQALLRGETIQVYRKEGMFDYIYAGDVAEGLLRLAASDAEGVVNLGNGNARRVSEVVEILRRYFPEMKAVEAESDIPFEASEADMTRFRCLTGWTPGRQLEDTIPEMIVHYRNLGNGSTADSATAAGSVLVSSVNGKVPLLKAVKRALDKKGWAGKVIGGDINPSCIGRYVADEFWTMPPIAELSPDRLVRECRERGIRAIVPTRDGELAHYARMKEHLASHGVQVMVSDLAVIDVCLDKLAFFQWGTQSGIPVIPTALSLSQLDGDRFVVKERRGAGARNIGVDLDREQALVHAAKLFAPVFQPYVEGQEISVDLYVDVRGRCKGVILRRRELVVGGESQVTATFRDERLERDFAHWAERLGIYGHAVMQALLDSAGNVHVIECNARVGGASMLSFEAGLDSLYWFFLESDGIDLEQFPFRRSHAEKRLVRHAEDLIL